MDKFEENLGKEVFILSEEKKNDCSLTFHKKAEEVSSYFSSSIAGNTDSWQFEYNRLHLNWRPVQVHIFQEIQQQFH